VRNGRPTASTMANVGKRKTEEATLRRMILKWILQEHSGKVSGEFSDRNQWRVLVNTVVWFWVRENSISDCCLLKMNSSLVNWTLVWSMLQTPATDRHYIHLLPNDSKESTFERTLLLGKACSESNFTCSGTQWLSCDVELRLPIIWLFLIKFLLLRKSVTYTWLQRLQNCYLNQFT
jgi:hypothetical protein